MDVASDKREESKAMRKGGEDEGQRGKINQ